ncbi:EVOLUTIONARILY CONSERVED C-TERMINAL REGION 5 [Salix viminalis]|uniref:YTH domain-containing family protein n=1 Tax=Salix viminalis TaxID=40686 RepID=A0A9Q0NU80_SALVM|nr:EVOLUTIONARILY CONSERVED C-TERMINAL REGION 5 [Salix viminalis]
MDVEEKLAETDNMEERILSAKNKTSVSSNSSQDTAPLGHPRDNTGQSEAFGSPGDHTVYPPNIHAPQAQAFYYRGYDNANDEWDEYPPYINAEGLEIGSPGVYNDNPSLVFHAGYGYSPQMPYGPYSPVTTPLPSVGGDAHLYSPQQFPFSGPTYYQHLVSQPEFNTLANIDQQGDNMLCGPRPSYPPPMGSISGGSFPGNHGFHDLQHGFDGLRSGGLCSASSKPSARNRPLSPFSPAVSPQPIGTFGSFGQNVGMASQQQRSFYSLESGSNSYKRAYLQSGYNQGSIFGSASISSPGTNSQGWLSLENSRLREGAVFRCVAATVVLIFLASKTEDQGPQSLRLKNIADHGPFVDDNKHSKPSAKIHDESYNQASNMAFGLALQMGIEKLDTAYSEAKDKQDPCPVFLLFSVNASAQFCGVAEMVGPVDFDKSVDYWQQDKWSGQFPVKWHIIKDVPNSRFRHIVLENNDNKPVTNSRDTQEVKLKHGVEMLNIFKNYESDMSIVDDFDFYEDRQKAMQDRKARQQASLMAVGVGGESEHRNAVTLPTDIIKQISKSFAQVIRLDESSKEGIVTDRASSGCDGSVGTRVKLEDGITTVSPSQTI